MDYQDMTWDEYTKLYARYLHRPVNELIDLAGDVKGKVVWDLCCGGGDLAMECIRRKAKHVRAVDASYSMMTPLREWKDRKGPYTRRLLIHTTPISMVCGHPLPDLVFCRQGVNYWLDKNSAFRVASSMRPGTVFVFNTFNTRPGLKPVTKEYHYDGAEFIETSWRVAKNGTVHHIQVREGMKPHVTSFQWLPRGTLFRILEPYFTMVEQKRGRTSLYKCTRKEI